MEPRGACAAPVRPTRPVALGGQRGRIQSPRRRVAAQSRGRPAQRGSRWSRRWKGLKNVDRDCRGARRRRALSGRRQQSGPFARDKRMSNHRSSKPRFQQIVLKACKAHKIGLRDHGEHRRPTWPGALKDGWNIIRSTLPAITQARAAGVKSQNSEFRIQKQQPEACGLGLHRQRRLPLYELLGRERQAKNRLNSSTSAGRAPRRRSVIREPRAHGCSHDRDPPMALATHYHIDHAGRGAGPEASQACPCWSWRSKSRRFRALMTVDQTQVDNYTEITTHDNVVIS